MTVSRFIHEGGLTANSVAQSEQFRDTYGLRPILAIDVRATYELDILLSVGGSPLEVYASTLHSSSANAALRLKSFALAYDVGAVFHHSRSLARAYSGVVGQFEVIRSIAGYTESEAEFVTLGYQQEPYYEFDALLSAARRVYDKVGHCAWQAFEGGGGMPRNMEKILDRLKHCPPQLADSLQRSWREVGHKLKDYRDCTQHFAAAEMGFGMVYMKRLDDVRIAWAPIPDNPEAKSAKKFSYAGGLDALKYGWETANEVISIAIETVSAADRVTE